MAIKSKKGFITHPLGMAFIALIVGIIIAVFLIRGNVFGASGIACPIA